VTSDRPRGRNTYIYSYRVKECHNQEDRCRKLSYG